MEWYLIISGLCLFPMGLYLGALWTKPGLFLTLTATVCLAYGLIAIVNKLPESDNTVQTTTNPLLDNQQSIEQGSITYVSNCVACHGENGMLIIDLSIHLLHHKDTVIYDSYITVSQGHLCLGSATICLKLIYGI